MTWCHLSSSHGVPSSVLLCPVAITRPSAIRPRYVENELLNMKSLFEEKEACLRRELEEERVALEREASDLRKNVEAASSEKAAAEVRRARGSSRGRLDVDAVWNCAASIAAKEKRF